MINTYAFSTDYACQLEGRDLELARWSKDENVAYCEDSSALFCERKSTGIVRAIAAIIASIVK